MSSQGRGAAALRR